MYGPEEERPSLLKYWLLKIYIVSLLLDQHYFFIVFSCYFLLIGSFTTGSGTFILLRWSICKVTRYQCLPYSEGAFTGRGWSGISLRKLKL